MIIDGITTPAGVTLDTDELGQIDIVQGSGKILKMVTFPILNNTLAAGSSAVTLKSFSFDKLYDTSKLLVRFDIGYSINNYTNPDSDVQFALYNSNSALYIKSEPLERNAEAFYATDTTHAYGDSISAATFQYHNFNAGCTIEDGTVTAGTINYELRGWTVFADLQLSRWQNSSVTITEVA